MTVSVARRSSPKRANANRRSRSLAPSASLAGVEQRLLAGRYELLEQLGDATWRATDNELGREVVVRLGEADVPGAALAHPSIQRLFDQGEADGQRYAVLEYLAGGTLAGRGELTGAAASELADALAYAHSAGVAHGALGADAILFDAEGRAKLAGFRGVGEPADDVAALAALVDRYGGTPTLIRPPAAAPPPRRRRGLALLLGAVALAAAGVAAAVLATSGDAPGETTTAITDPITTATTGSSEEQPPPPTTRETTTATTEAPPATTSDTEPPPSTIAPPVTEPPLPTLPPTEPPELPTEPPTEPPTTEEPPPPSETTTS